MLVMLLHFSCASLSHFCFRPKETPTTNLSWVGLADILSCYFLLASVLFSPGTLARVLYASSSPSHTQHTASVRPPLPHRNSGTLSSSATYRIAVTKFEVLFECYFAKKTHTNIMPLPTKVHLCWPFRRPAVYLKARTSSTIWFYLRTLPLSPSS